MQRPAQGPLLTLMAAASTELSYTVGGGGDLGRGGEVGGLLTGFRLGIIGICRAIRGKEEHCFGNTIPFLHHHLLCLLGLFG